jgi:hypothetical protein
MLLLPFLPLNLFIIEVQLRFHTYKRTKDGIFLSMYMAAEEVE